MRFACGCTCSFPSTRPAATVYPLVQRDDRRWVARGKAAVRVPALHLGRRVDANAGSGAHAATFAPAAASVPAGGPLLRTVHLSARLFEATAMKAVEQDLMDMTVVQLQEELEVRGEVKSGSKAWLRRRLHAAIVRGHLEAVEAERRADGG